MSQRNLAQALADSPDHKDNLAVKWSKSLQLVQKEVSSQAFSTWISPILPAGYVNNQLILRIPSQFFFEWIESHYKEIIQNSVGKIFGLNTQIDYLIASSRKPKPEKIELEEAEETHSKSALEEKKDQTSGLDPRYWFDNFLVKNDNELAWRAAKTVAKQPGKTDYNPLFIYGDTGCGKTHLIMAVGNFIFENRKRKKIHYLTAEGFLNEYIYALQHRKLEAYNAEFHRIDVLLFDDIHFLSNKMKSQEALFYFLSEMERSRKQVVLTSNQPPAHLSGFNPYLASFLQKGLIVDLIPPSYETKLAWINTYSENNNLTLSADLKEFLANSFPDGLHKLRTIMVRIAAQKSLLGQKVSINSLKRLLSQIDSTWAKRNGNFQSVRPVKIGTIIKQVSQYMNIPPDVLISFSRQREITMARQIAIYLSRELSGESLKVIGYHFKDRHYTAILHSYKRIAENLKTNPMLVRIINEIKKQVLEKTKP